MQNKIRRIFCSALALLLVLSCTAALAETWVCPYCGFKENIGVFCSMCGKQRPATAVTATPEPVYYNYEDPTLEQIPQQQCGAQKGVDHIDPSHSAHAICDISGGCSRLTGLGKGGQRQ